MLSTKDKKYLLIYSGSILMAYLIAGILIGNMFGEAKEDARKSNLARMSPNGIETNRIPPMAVYSDKDAVLVKTGIYVDSILDISIRNSQFKIDMYVWFTWQGNKDLNPGDKFTVVNGKIENKILTDEFYLEDGTCYQSYKVIASIRKVFNASNLGLDEHMLNVYIEDVARTVEKIIFVVDETSSINPQLEIPGYAVTKFESVAKKHTYPTTYNDPLVKKGELETYSEFITAISIKKENMGLFFKLALPFIISVFTALTTLWASPTDAPRFGLTGSALFCIIAFSHVVSTLLPSASGAYSILDILSLCALVSVFLIAATSISALNLYTKHNKKYQADMLDRLSFFAISIGYLFINIYLPWVVYLS